MAFFDIVTKPQLIMAAEKNNARLNAALKSYALYGALIGFPLGIGIALFAGFLAAIVSQTAQQNPITALIGGLGIAAIIVVPIVMAILVCLVSCITYGIYWLIAKLLGGTGTFTQNIFLGSKLVWPLLVIGLIVGILQLIPVLGFLVSVAWIIYSSYLMLILLSVANNISKLRAFIVWLIPVIFILLLVILLFGSLLAATLATPAL